MHDSNHYDIEKIYVGLSWVVRLSDGGHGETKGLITPHQGEFLHNYCTFVSLHSDHDGVVRIFAALSCEL